MANFYKAWEPPTRSELPDRDDRILYLTRTEGNEPLVTIGEEPLEQKLVYHSPDGFEFGYLGSGPADLALNVLHIFVSEQEAFRLHQQFKFAVLRRIGFHGGAIKLQEVVDWIRATYNHELTDPACVEQEKLLREAFEDPDSDPLEAPATIDELYPPYHPELIKECASPHCKECRTGESDEANWYANVARILGRSIETEYELELAKYHYNHGADPETTAIAIRDDVVRPCAACPVPTRG